MKQKSGFSIIILIITVIVLITLSAAVLIPAFKEDGIFSKTRLSVAENNDAILSEKITKKNLESMKTKQAFTEKTIKLLKNTVRQSGIDIDKLEVYINNNEEQLVVYKWDKVTKEEVKWFLDNTVSVQINNRTIQCKIYPLFGDANCDNNLDQEDINEVKKCMTGAKEITPNILLACDIDRDGVLDLFDISAIKWMISGIQGINEDNTSSAVIRITNDELRYEDIDNKIREYFEITD